MRLHYDDGKNGIRDPGAFAVEGTRARLAFDDSNHRLRSCIQLRMIHGLVLEENFTMLRMCAEFGFEINDDDDAHGLKRVSLALTQPTEAKITGLP